MWRTFKVFYLVNENNKLVIMLTLVLPKGVVTTPTSFYDVVLKHLYSPGKGST